jgi:hypothetical protein
MQHTSYAAHTERGCGRISNSMRLRYWQSLHVHEDDKAKHPITFAAQCSPCSPGSCRLRGRHLWHIVRPCIPKDIILIHWAGRRLWLLLLGRPCDGALVLDDHVVVHLAVGTGRSREKRWRKTHG